MCQWPGRISLKHERQMDFTLRVNLGWLLLAARRCEQRPLRLQPDSVQKDACN